MDYCKKITTLFELENLSKMRIEQLEREEKIDRKLEECSQTCPVQVLRYYVNSRVVNRWYAKQIHNSSILDYPKHIKRAYDDIRSVQKQFWWETPYLEEPIGNSYHRWDHTDENMKPCTTICNQLLPTINEMMESWAETMRNC